MAKAPATEASKIHNKIGHPIIDADGHMLDLPPLFQDYLREVGGSQMVEKYTKADDIGFLTTGRQWFSMSPEERRSSWTTCPAWWTWPTRSTYDRATMSLPHLLYKRLDEIGIDYTILYQGLIFPRLEDKELRLIGCRAYNTYVSEVYGEHPDRMTPAAAIPMHSPKEAITELEHIVKVLGLKVVMMAGHVRRPIPDIHRRYPELASVAYRLDTFGIDSEYDYDPVWAKCAELKVSPSTHQTGMGIGTRQSISNFSYNHIGHFASSADALCKSLFLGGVTRRFPNLSFAFLENGVGQACTLYADLVGHWEKET